MTANVVQGMTVNVIVRVGQNRIYTPYMTVCMVISLPKYRIHTVYIWFWPTLQMWSAHRLYIGLGQRRGTRAS